MFTVIQILHKCLVLMLPCRDQKMVVWQVQEPKKQRERHYQYNMTQIINDFFFIHPVEQFSSHAQRHIKWKEYITWKIDSFVSHFRVNMSVVRTISVTPFYHEEILARLLPGLSRHSTQWWCNAWAENCLAVCLAITPNQATFLNASRLESFDSFMVTLVWIAGFFQRDEQSNLYI